MKSDKDIEERIKRMEFNISDGRAVEYSKMVKQVLEECRNRTKYELEENIVGLCFEHRFAEAKELMWLLED